MKLKYFLLTIGLSTVFSAVGQELKIGAYTFKDGGVYTGELAARKPSGKGKTAYPNGDTYEGQYVKGKRQGEGTYSFIDGEKYEGQWFQDQQHGKGTFYFQNNI